MSVRAWRPIARTRILSRLLIAAAVTLLPGLGNARPSPDTARAPLVNTANVRLIARGVWVVPDDHHVPLVPNVGIIEGTQSIMVVDTGLGPRNGAAVFRLAQRIAHGRHIILTTTHMHPEHALGASAFPDRDYIADVDQAAEIGEKLQGLGELFKTFGPTTRAALTGFRVVLPSRTYRGETSVDLGGRSVVLREMPAHTRGDEIVIIPDVATVFTGDLVEETSFPVLFDADSRGDRWITVLKQLKAMHPVILVPGHRHISTTALIEPQLAYLEQVQSLVGEAVRGGQSQSEATARLTPILGAMHPNWQFKGLIPYEIAIFYAEAIGKPALMPNVPSGI